MVVAAGAAAAAAATTRLGSARLITLTSTLTLPDITKTSSSNRLLLLYLGYSAGLDTSKTVFHLSVVESITVLPFSLTSF